MYQLNGDNAGQLVAEGVGHEQDIAVGFNRGFLGERLGLSTYLNVVLYPFASKEDAGTRVPVVLEPAVGLAYSTFVDLGLELTWSVGVQDAISDGRFLYINPTLGKELGLTSSLSMALGAGLGVKVFHDPEANPDNQFDLAFDCEFPVKLAGNVSVKPGVHIGWTDLDGKSAGDEYFVFGSLVMALSL
jgi:hypothetical protein